MTNKAACQHLLWTILPGGWDVVAHFSALVKSMPDQVQAVIDADGWYICY